MTTVPSSYLPSPFDELMEQANQLARQDALADALDVLEEILTTNPHHNDALFLKTQLLVEIGKPTEALSCAQFMQEIDPTNPMPYYGSAWAKGIMGDYDGEIEDALKGLALKPAKRAPFFRRLGHAYSCLQEYEKAKDCFNTVLDETPNHHATLFNRAKLYLLLKEPEQAMMDLRRAMVFSPTWSWPHEAMGSIFLDYFSKPGDAIPHFDKAIELDGTFQVAYFKRGTASLRLAQKATQGSDEQREYAQNARYDFRQAMENDYDDTACRLELAKIEALLTKPLLSSPNNANPMVDTSSEPSGT